MPRPNPHHSRPWHRDSLFGDGPRRPLDREQRAVWRARLDLHRRAGRITALHALVGLALARRLGTDGRLDPSHDTIADDTGCSARTVRRALAALAGCGLARWTRRLVRDGWRAVQASSAYELLTGAPASVPCDGQDGRETRKTRFSLGAGGTPAAGTPSQGSDEWGKWNAARQLRLLAG
jgi:hypothetical protein